MPASLIDAELLGTWAEPLPNAPRAATIVREALCLQVLLA